MDAKKRDELKRRVEALPLNRRGRRRYSAEVRSAVLGFLRECSAKGISEAKACAAIGVHQATASDWRKTIRKSGKKSALREVAVPAMTVSMPVAVTFPDGATVTGLDAAGVAELIRALR